MNTAAGSVRPQTNEVPEQSEDAKLPENLDLAMFRTELDAALQNLSEDHRESFHLRYFEELSTKEIAEIMGCPEGTVRSRLFYTLRQLAGQLKIFQTP